MIMAENEDEQKSLLMRVKEKSERASLRLNIKETKIMASHYCIANRREKKNLEAVMVFLFLGSKITVDGDCSHDIQKCLLFGKKSMTNPDSVLKTSDITLVTKVHKIKAMFFPVAIYGCASWTIEKAEC